MADADIQPSTRQRRSIAQNALMLFGSQAVTWTLTGAVLLVLPRLFGVEAIGRYAIATSIWSVAATLIAFGTTMYVTLESARRPHDVKRIVAETIRLRAVSVCITWALVLGFVAAIGYSSEIVLLAVVVGVIATSDAFVEIVNAALIGMEEMGAVARADVVSRTISTVLLLAVALSTRNLLATIAMGIVASLVRATQIVPVLRRAPAADVAVRWTDARVAARRSSPFFVAAIVQVVYSQIDTIVMSVLLDEREVGWYGAATLVFGTLLFAPNIVLTSLLPALTREHLRDRRAAHELLGKAFDSLVILAVAVGLATTICARGGVRLLFGDEFAPAHQVLAVLGVVVLFTFVLVLLGGYAYATERQRFWNVLMIVSAAISVPLDFVLVPWTERAYDNGAIGGALAFLVTEAIMVVVGVAVLVPDLLTRSRISRLARCAIAGAAMLAAGWPLRGQFVVLTGAVSLVVYSVAVLVLRIPTTDEYGHARAALATVTRGRFGAPRVPADGDAGHATHVAATPSDEPLTDWALLTRLLSLREAERTMTPTGWQASGEVGRAVNASDELSRALSSHLGSWVGELARGAANDDPHLAPYRTLATAEDNWNPDVATDERRRRDRRTLLALLVVDAVRAEPPAIANGTHPPVPDLVRRGEPARTFGRRMVDAGVLSSWEQVADLDDDELARCLTDPATIRVRYAPQPDIDR